MQPATDPHKQHERNEHTVASLFSLVLFKEKEVQGGTGKGEEGEGEGARKGKEEKVRRKLQ